MSDNVTPASLRRTADDVKDRSVWAWRQCEAAADRIEDLEREVERLKAIVGRAEPAFVSAMDFRNRCTEELIVEPLRRRLEAAEAVCSLIEWREGRCHLPNGAGTESLYQNWRRLRGTGGENDKITPAELRSMAEALEHREGKGVLVPGYAHDARRAAERIEALEREVGRLTDVTISYIGENARLRSTLARANDESSAFFERLKDADALTDLERAELGESDS